MATMPHGNLNSDEMNGLRADAMEILLNKAREVPGVVIRPVIGLIMLQGVNIQRIDIEDSEIRVNASNLDEFMQRQVDVAADSLLIPRKAT